MKSVVAEGLRVVALPEVDARVAAAVGPAWWPLERLGEGIEVLARRAGLRPHSCEDLDPVPSNALRSAEFARWMTWACDRLGIEAEAVDAAVPDLRALLDGAGPAIVPHIDGRGRGFLLLLRRRRGSALLIAPDRSVRRCPIAALRTALCWRFEAPLTPEIDALLDAAEVRGARRARARAGLLAERLAGDRVGPVWMLRLPPSAPFRRQLARARLSSRFAAMLALFATGYVAEILGWSLIGSALLGGRFDAGWFAAWFLLLVSTVPLRLVAHWLDATFALAVGRLLKSRLMAGALRMDLDTVRQQGSGHLLGRVVESQALEGLAVNGGMTALVAVLELGFASWLLAAGAGGLPHAMLLAASLAAVVWFGWRYAHRVARWTATRLDLTHELVERMVGHRTVLAQERPERRDAREDRAIDDYLRTSQAMDRAIVPILAGAPAGWLVVGLAGLVPAFVAGGATPTAFAIGIGGVLFAQRALATLGGSVAALARAVVAWRQVDALFRAGGEAPAAQRFVPQPARAATTGATLVDAHGLTFGYRPGVPVIDRVDVSIAVGDRILLEGPSGGGKSTLAALLTGLRLPQAGLMLLHGLDRPTHGDDWHRLATAAPQFNENHVLSGSVAFNLLMGRAWPAADDDLADAQALCEALGLGDLLRRMPGGLMQRIGETGWQLSHGERSRLYLARALLQNADLTILDESFAALDPETLARCLRCAIDRARTLVVIAHP